MTLYSEQPESSEKIANDLSNYLKHKFVFGEWLFIKDSIQLAIDRARKAAVEEKLTMPTEEVHQIQLEYEEAIRSESRKSAFLRAAEIAEKHIKFKVGGIWGDGYDTAVMDITKTILAEAEK